MSLRRVISWRRIAVVLLGLVLNSVVISSSFTFFESFYRFSTTYMGEDKNLVVIYSPGASTLFTGSVPMQLVSMVKEMKGVQEVSPEIMTPCVTNGGNLFVVRGITPNYYELQSLEAVHGEVQLNSPSECIVGVRAAERLGLEVGSFLTAVSSFQNSIQEFRVAGIFLSETPSDDEVLVSLERARNLANTRTQDQATLIRVKVDPKVVDPVQIRKKVLTQHELRVELSSPEKFTTDLKVLDMADNLVREMRVKVPGDTSMLLNEGVYIIQVQDKNEALALDENTTRSISLDRKLVEAVFNVYNITTGEPIVGALVEITGESGEGFNRSTDEKGVAKIYLGEEKYSVKVSYEGLEKQITAILQEGFAGYIGLGKIPLHVYAYNATSTQPITGAQVEVKGRTTKSGKTDETGYYNAVVGEGNYNITLSLEKSTVFRLVKLERETTVSFALGELNKTVSLSAKIMWINGTAAGGASLSLRNSGTEWWGVSDAEGTCTVQGMPAGSYEVIAEKGDYQITRTHNLTEDTSLVIPLPTPLGLEEAEYRPEYIRYLPRGITVGLSERVFSDSMKMVVNTITGTLLIFGILFTFASTLNGFEAIKNAVNENSNAYGVLRAIGATRSESMRLMGSMMALGGLLAGACGYLIGFNIMRLLSYEGYILLSGYSLVPRYSPVILVTVTLFSFTVTLLGLVRSVGELQQYSVMALLKGLRRGEVLHFPHVPLGGILAFIIPITVRAIPELLSWPFPIGYETLRHFVPVILDLRSGFESTAYESVFNKPFLWVASTLPYPSPEAPLKVYPVFIHGLLGVAIYLFARTVYKEKWKPLAVSLLCTLHFVPLRVSADLHQVELSLVLVFLTLSILRTSSSSWGRIMVLLLSAATIFTHESVSVILLFSLIFKVFTEWRKGNNPPETLLVAFPLVVLFIFRLEQTGGSLIVNAMYSGIYPSETLKQTMCSGVTLLGYITGLLLPLFFLGLGLTWESPSLNGLMLASLGGALSPVISPYTTLNDWHVYAMVSVYPMIFYAVEGLDRLARFKLPGKPSYVNLRTFTGILYTVILTVPTLTFITPSTGGSQHIHVFGEHPTWISHYIPENMQKGTLSKEDADSSWNCLSYMSTTEQDPTALITDEEFIGYAKIYFQRKKIPVYKINGTKTGNPDWQEEVLTETARLGKLGYEVYLLSWHMKTENYTRVANHGNVNLYRTKKQTKN